MNDIPVLAVLLSLLAAALLAIAVACVVRAGRRRSLRAKAFFQSGAASQRLRDEHIRREVDINEQWRRRSQGKEP